MRCEMNMYERGVLHISFCIGEGQKAVWRPKRLWVLRSYFLDSVYSTW